VVVVVGGGGCGNGGGSSSSSSKKNLQVPLSLMGRPTLRRAICQTDSRGLLTAEAPVLTQGTEVGTCT
jgi:hypothetical protein